MLEQLKNKQLDPETIFHIFQKFYYDNEGDDTTTDILVAIFCEILDVSADTLIDMLPERDTV